MTTFPLIGFLRLHRRIALALLGVVISTSIILPACGDGTGAIAPPGDPDYGVTKVGVLSGQTITYTITVSNHAHGSGPVTLTDVISTAPAGSQFTQATGATCTANSALSYTCSVASMPIGGSRTVTLVLTIPPGVSGGIVNCASVPTDGNNTNNQACVENVITAAPITGTITIIKDAVPDDPQDFHFTSSSSAIPGFDLDDDANATLSNQKVFTNVPAGTYTFTETQVAGWDLSGIACVPSAGTTVSLPTASATIVLTGGGNVTCTFTNKVGTPTTGTITIIKDAVPNVAQDFGFTSDKAAIAGFLLDDDADGTLPNQRVFANVAADTYIITETATAGWSLANVACTPAASVVANIAAGTATITLAGGANVSCTYTNIPVLPVVAVVSTTTASSTTSSVTLTGTGFFSNSDVTLRNTATGETFTNRSVTSTTSTQIVFTHTFGVTAAAQSFTVEVTSPSGAKSGQKSFTVLASVPAIATLTTNPTPATTGTPLTLTIGGRDFASTAEITINVTPVNDQPFTLTKVGAGSLVLTGSSQIVAPFTPTTAGRYDITVLNGPTGIASNIMSFNVTGPSAPATITGVTPGAPTGSASPQTFTITGTGIQQPILGNDVGFRNVTTGQTFGCPTSCSVVSSSSTQIVLMPTFPIASTVQNWTVTVNNPGAPASNAFAFTVNPPTPAITAVSTTPSAPVAGAPFTLTITGSNFSSTEGRIRITGPGCATGCTIENSALTTSTSTTLTGSLTLSTGGTYSATVQNGAGPTSNALTFNVTAPNPAAFIQLTPTVLTTSVGGTTTTTASFLDAGRQPTNSGCTVAFSATDAGGMTTVSSSGLTATVTGRTAGTTGLRAACTSGTSIAPFTATVRVTQPPLNVAKVTISPRFNYFPESGSASEFQFTAVAQDANGNVIAAAGVSYSVTSTGTATVSVDGTGLVRIGPTSAGPLGPARRGGGIVTATSGGQTTFASFSYGAVGTIVGRITSTGGQSLRGVTVTASGAAAGPVPADVDGDGYFALTGLSAGNYVVETVAANGTLLGTSTVAVTVGNTTELPNRVVAVRASAVYGEK